MPKWAMTIDCHARRRRDLRRFLNKHGRYKRSGDDLVYEYKGQLVRVSKSSGEIGRNQWRHILKHDLGITQEEFYAGL